MPPCLRSRRSSAARRSSTASSAPGSPSSALAVAPQLAGQVVGLDSASARQRSASASSAGVDARDAVQPRAGRGQQRRATPVPSSGATASRARRAPRARSASTWRRRSRAARSSDLLGLRSARPPRSRAARTRAGRARGRARPARSRSSSSGASQRAHAARGRRAARPRAPRCAGAAEAVEDLQLRGGQRQLAVLVLAVERDQPAGRPRAGRRPPPSARSGTPACAPRRTPAARAPAPRRRRGSRSPSSAAQPVGQLEDPLDVGLRRARAHDPRRARGRRAAGRARGPAPSCPRRSRPSARSGPGARRSSARSISRRFSTRSSWSTSRGLPAPPTDEHAFASILQHRRRRSRRSRVLRRQAPELLAQAAVERRARRPAPDRAASRDEARRRCASPGPQLARRAGRRSRRRPAPASGCGPPARRSGATTSARAVSECGAMNDTT